MKVEDQRAKGEKLPEKIRGSHKIWIGSYLLLSAGCFVCFFLMKLEFFGLLGNVRFWLIKISIAAALGFLVMGLSKWTESLITRHNHHKAERYNLIRLIRLVTVIIIVAIFISALYQNWYSAVVSLGLISLILGFALQTPISSFIGWLYIILRNPFRVGDRIQIDTFKGDVVEIGYLDTTLWEFGGDYLTSDLPTGRLIRFPNSMVLSGAVFNYSWGEFPYIWNELPFYVAYESDFEYVGSTLRQVAKAELGDHMLEDIERLKALINDTAIDEIKIREYPFVIFRTNANTWVEATLIYLVPPRQASTIRSSILKKGVSALLAEPDKVLFPKGPNR